MSLRQTWVTRAGAGDPAAGRRRRLARAGSAITFRAPTPPVTAPVLVPVAALLFAATTMVGTAAAIVSSPGADARRAVQNGTTADV
ncbi:MAG: hypothetical protein IRZ05_12120 [Micromonosporaceae bacterium]|nr:hypothetical protein [Micromonosporaceae bacterium]